MSARQQRRQRADEDAEVSSNADLEAPSTMQFDAVTTATPLGGVAVPEFTARTDVATVTTPAAARARHVVATMACSVGEQGGAMAAAERRARAEVFGGNLL
jgi:hypothetical protein